MFLHVLGGGGEYKLKHASYHINHMWLITRMHKDLLHCQLFYQVWYCKWFSKMFSLVQSSSQICLSRCMFYFKFSYSSILNKCFLYLKCFIKVSFRTCFTKEYQVVIFLSIKVFPMFLSKSSFMPYTFTC